MTVQIAQSDQFEHVISLLTLAFVDDPVCRYLYPDTAQYLTFFPEYARIYGGPGLECDGVYLYGTAGAAVWVPPGRHPDEAALDALLARSVTDAAKPELYAVYAEFARGYPPEPHWFLPLMGVDPFLRGRGIGAALMMHAIEVFDREGYLAYLESTKPSNVPFYARFGFVRYGKIEVGGHPPVTTMVRRPR